MARSKRFVVIGLGSFGTALALKLAENGCRVTGIDQRKDRVDGVKTHLYEALIGNATERETLEHLAVNEADAVFISLGENITQSLLATLHVKELGARNVIVKGVTEEHGKILKHMGVDRIVFPEIEVAGELADRMTWPNVLDFLPIDPEYSLIELAVPAGLAGKTLMQLDLRKRYHIWVVGVKDALTGNLTIFPDANHMLNEDQLLLVVGKQESLNVIREMR